jgi:hypothetical protein
MDRNVLELSGQMGKLIVKISHNVSQNYNFHHQTLFNTMSFVFFFLKAFTFIRVWEINQVEKLTPKRRKGVLLGQNLCLFTWILMVNEKTKD